MFLHEVKVYFAMFYQTVKLLLSPKETDGFMSVVCGSV
jgi:hypothetical protein